MSAALRAWVRYVVPFTLLACIAIAPVVLFALRMSPPADVAAARVQVRIVWALAGVAAALQLWLVAGVAPGVRSVVAGAPLSQLGALGAGAKNLVRGVLPSLVAITAVLLGGLALVIPGVVVAVLVALVGASDQLGTTPQAAIADSVAVVRSQLPRIAMLVVAVVAVDLAITFAAQTAFVPLIAKKATAAKLVPVLTFARVTALALTVVSPLLACLLAGAYSHAKRR